MILVNDLNRLKLFSNKFNLSKLIELIDIILEKIRIEFFFFVIVGEFN